MNIDRGRLYRILLFSFIGVSVVASGLFYAEKLLIDRLSGGEKRLEFTLLDTNNNLFKFDSSELKKKTMIFFSPNKMSRDFQESYKALMQPGIEVFQQEFEILLISSVDMDTLYNVARVSNFVGKILNDPSGSVYQQILPKEIYRKNLWYSVLISKAGVIQWVREATRPVFPE